MRVSSYFTKSIGVELRETVCRCALLLNLPKILIQIKSRDIPSEK